MWGDKDPAAFEADHTTLTAQGHILRQHADGMDVAGDDHLFGGRDTDVLLGGSEDDTYYFGYGDGVDVVLDTSGFDSINLVGDIAAADVRFEERAGSLIIALSRDGTPTGDQIVVTDYFNGKPVETIEVGKSEVLSVADIEAETGRAASPPDPAASPPSTLIVLTEQADAPMASAGDDIIFGLGGNDVLAGSSGADRIFGGEGDGRNQRERGR